MLMVIIACQPRTIQWEKWKVIYLQVIIVILKALITSEACLVPWGYQIVGFNGLDAVEDFLARYATPFGVG